MAETGGWKGLEIWAKMNPERLYIEGASWSLADAIQRSPFAGSLPADLANQAGISPELYAKIAGTVDIAGNSAAKYAGQAGISVAKNAGLAGKYANSVLKGHAA